MQKTLDKISEIGLGECILIPLVNFNEEIFDIPFSDSISSKRWKKYYFNIDLKDEFNDIQSKFINTLNNYNFIKYLILDYFSFCIFVSNIEKINPHQQVFEKIIVFDPIKVKNKFINYISPDKISTFTESQYILPKHCRKLLETDIFSKLNNINCGKVLIIGKRDTKFALKLASKIKNSQFNTIKKFLDFEKIIKDEFKTKQK